MAEPWRFKLLVTIVRTIVIFFVTSIAAASIIGIATAPEPKSHSGHGAIKSNKILSTSKSSYEKSKIQVYYEVLCPWSRDYITQEFIPAIIKFKKYVDYELIPYGHASTKTLTESGVTVTKFECQHGALECEGNMLHACAIANPFGNLHERIPPFNPDDHLLGFLGCTLLDEVSGSSRIIPKSDFASIGEKCANKFGLDWEQIHTCWKGDQGIKLLESMGESTKALRPPLKTVPHVRFNGSQTHERNLRQNLESFLCSQIQSQFLEKLAICKGIDVDVM